MDVSNFNPEALSIEDLSILRQKIQEEEMARFRHDEHLDELGRTALEVAAEEGVEGPNLDIRAIGRICVEALHSAARGSSTESGAGLQLGALCGLPEPEEPDLAPDVNYDGFA